MTPPTRETYVPPRSGMRRQWVAGGIILLLLLGGGAAAGAVALSGTPAPQQEAPIDVTTATIERGTLTGTTQSSGTLAFAGPHDLSTSLSGILTAIPAAGTELSLGDSLYAIDNASVFLFFGALPAWRSFAEGMVDGPDVIQLEESLSALGYFDRQPDEEFTSATADAIEDWQEATGQEETGAIDLGRIVFQPGAIRVSSTTVTIGTGVGPGTALLTISGRNKQVKVELKLANQKLAQVGQKVTIGLPGGASAGGTVSAVGVPTEKDSNGQKSVVIPVVVSLDDQASVGDIQQASVTVQFPSETKEDVLSVPVEALLALSPDTFGVEIVDADGTTTKREVTTGLFAGGRVEISGEGLSEGQSVLVPSR